jgi:hypothetical protein
MNFCGERKMTRALAFVFVLCFVAGLTLHAEEASPAKAAVQSNANIPEG